MSRDEEPVERVREMCAKVCEDMQSAKDALVPDGAWTTLGTTEISGRQFAAAIMSLDLSSLTALPQGGAKPACQWCGNSGYVTARAPTTGQDSRMKCNHDGSLVWEIPQEHPCQSALILARAALRRWQAMYAHLSNETTAHVARAMDYNLPPADHVAALEAIEEALK